MKLRSNAWDESAPAAPASWFCPSTTVSPPVRPVPFRHRAAGVAWRCMLMAAWGLFACERHRDRTRSERMPDGTILSRAPCTKALLVGYDAAIGRFDAQMR